AAESPVGGRSRASAKVAPIELKMRVPPAEKPEAKEPESASDLKDIFEQEKYPSSNLGSVENISGSRSRLAGRLSLRNEDDYDRKRSMSPTSLNPSQNQSLASLNRISETQISPSASRGTSRDNSLTDVCATNQFTTSPKAIQEVEEPYDERVLKQQLIVTGIDSLHQGRLAGRLSLRSGEDGKKSQPFGKKMISVSECSSPISPVSPNAIVLGGTAVIQLKSANSGSTVQDAEDELVSPVNGVAVDRSSSRTTVKMHRPSPSSSLPGGTRAAGSIARQISVTSSIPVPRTASPINASLHSHPSSTVEETDRGASVVEMLENLPVASSPLQTHALDNEHTTDNVYA
ncbi:hypothetical protein HDU91_000977, partial [Kappamyces sp. JEL0680]